MLRQPLSLGLELPPVVYDDAIIRQLTGLEKVDFTPKLADVSNGRCDLRCQIFIGGAGYLTS